MKAGKRSLLLFVDSTVRGGVEEHILTLANGLCRDGFSFILACPPELLALMDRDLAGEVERCPIDTSGGAVRAAARVRAMLRRLRPDVVHAHLFRSCVLAVPSAKMGGIRTIETCHGPEVWRSGWLKRSYVFDRLVVRFVDRFIAVSHAAREHLVRNKRVPRERIRVIWNGRDLRQYSLHSRQRPRAEHAAEVAIGVVGRLDEQKGHRYLIAAMPAILREIPGASFIFVGDGPLRESLERQAIEVGVRDRVRFDGYRADIPRVLGEFDLFVLPSLYEGLPLVLVEAGAAGLPVVATNVDGSAEVVKDGETGRLVAPRDPAALAAAIIALCKSDALRSQLGRAGHERMVRFFSLERQLEETAKVYESLLAGTTSA